MLSVNHMDVGSITLEHIQQRICHHKFYFLKKEPVKAPLQLSGGIDYSRCPILQATGKNEFHFWLWDSA